MAQHHILVVYHHIDLVDVYLMERKILRPRRFAEELDVTEPTLRKLMRLGLPYMQIRRAIWIDRDRALRWMAEFEKRKDPPKRQELEEATTP
jgi:transposase-like protein